MSGLCLRVSGLCLRVSGWGLSVSGDVLIPNMLVKMYKSHASSDIAFSSSALYYVKRPMSGGCLDGVCGCLWVSGSYLGVCSRCLGENRCHINHNHQLNRSCHIKLLPFLHSQKVLDCWVSVGGLEGVWRVTLDTVWYTGYPILIIFGHNN